MKPPASRPANTTRTTKLNVNGLVKKHHLMNPTQKPARLATSQLPKNFLSFSMSPFLGSIALPLVFFTSEFLITWLVRVVVDKPPQLNKAVY
jgi:hypothetical protein